MKTVNWGVLGVARIATKKVIPAMLRARGCQVVGIASREGAKAEAAAEELGIQRAYASYEDLIADPDIEAIYNPLPNHMHVPWSIKAAEAGKHVLCEKPIALTAEEARQLIEVRDRTGVKIEEAFMVRTHPQWLRAREIVRSGEIGELRAIQSFFSYYNRDPKNVRNVRAWGGGGVMDIGCYPITMSRFIFEDEPSRVAALVEVDPEFGTDRLVSALMAFPKGQSTFTCSTQLEPHQRVQIFGTGGRVEILIPWNAPPDEPCRIVIWRGGDLAEEGPRVEQMPVCDQYTIQAEHFARAIRDEEPVAVPLEDSVKNMEVIEAVLRSGASGRWEAIGQA
jgi:predicted dehydrogenase